MLRTVLVAAMAVAIALGGILWSAATEAAPSAGNLIAARHTAVAQQTPKKKRKKTPKKKTAAARAATSPVT
jgi:hypothetical protein